MRISCGFYRQQNNEFLMAEKLDQVQKCPALHFIHVTCYSLAPEMPWALLLPLCIARGKDLAATGLVLP